VFRTILDNKIYKKCSFDAAIWRGDDGPNAEQNIAMTVILVLADEKL